MSMPDIFSRKHLLKWFYVLGVLLLIATAWLSWSKLSLNPERVFWGMIEQSLQTTGVSAQSTQEDGQGGTLEQKIQYSLGVINKAQSHTSITQGDAQVRTVVIGTKDNDYTQYVGIKSTRRDIYDQPLDFSSVVGVWAKSDSSEGNSLLLSQALLGLSLPIGAMPVPIGNLPPEAREKLIDQIKHEEVYKTDFTKAKKETSNGRTYFVYDVKMQAIAYVHLMKDFAQAVGLHDLDQLDPNTYQGAAPMQVQLKVDARSKQLVSVYIVDSDFRQMFSGYDIPVDVSLPEQTISGSELQQRLDELQ